METYRCKGLLGAFKQIQKNKLLGFTLVELLIAVLIIGVLTAMALPMYQKSVDKSRYATLMPLAKNIKDAQEAFYLGGGKYSQDLGSLDVRVPGNPSGATATLSDGTTVEISTDDGFGYVKMGKENLNNHYIVYQDRSTNFPGEIHCEALSSSDRAQELCQNLGGQKISGSLTSGYTTYILSGSGAGSLATVGACIVNTSQSTCVRYSYSDGSAYEEYTTAVTGTQVRRDYDVDGQLTYIRNITPNYTQEGWYENGVMTRLHRIEADGSAFEYIYNAATGQRETLTNWNESGQRESIAVYDETGNARASYTSFYASDPTLVSAYTDYSSGQTEYYEDGSIKGYGNISGQTSKGQAIWADGEFATYAQNGSLTSSNTYLNGVRQASNYYNADGTYVSKPYVNGAESTDASIWTTGTYTTDASGNVTRSDGVYIPGSSNYPTLCEAHPDFAQCAG